VADAGEHRRRWGDGRGRAIIAGMTDPSGPPDTSADEHRALGQALVDAAYLRGDFILSSGARSSFYFDKFLFETKPAVLGQVATAMAALIPEGTDRLAGPELGGVALATAVSLASGLPFVIVRKEAKGYGTAKVLEGEVHEGERIVITEDVVTSAGEALKAATKLEEAGVVVAGIVAVLDREQGGAANIAAAGYPFASVFTLGELGV
jgi:orotate phosphoribosyltransferase